MIARNIIITVSIIILGSAVSRYASPQSTNASLTFEVASVRITGEAAESATSKRGKSGTLKSAAPSANPVRFSRRGITLARLLMVAYRIPLPRQLIGPGWLDSNTYDIEALAPEGSTSEQQQVMLQNLLIERFSMKMHRDMREMPIYEMVVARRGPKLTASDPNSKNPLAPFDVMRPIPSVSARPGGIGMTGFNERGTMEGFAARLSRYVDRPIVDRTGLKGEYNVSLRWVAGSASAALGVR